MNNALRILLILLAISLAASAVTGSMLYFRLSYLWGLILVGSWIMSRISLRSVQVTRSARFLRSQVGQIFEERYEIFNQSRLPRLWLEVRDESSLPGSHGSHVLTLIGGRESRTYLARTRLVERGVFPLGPTVLESGDLFGLYPNSRSFPSQDTLLVYPMIVEVKDFPNPPGLLPGGEALRRRTPQITSNAAGVREYSPGDPLNRIHWVSTARRNRLIVKEFELDPLAEVWLFIDAAAAVHASRLEPVPEFDPQDVWRRKYKFSLPTSTMEYAVTIAASLARFYLHRSRAVGLVSSGESLQVLPSDRGGRQLGKILEALALLRAEGDLPLHGLVEAAGAPPAARQHRGADYPQRFRDGISNRGYAAAARIASGCRPVGQHQLWRVFQSGRAGCQYANHGYPCLPGKGWRQPGGYLVCRCVLGSVFALARVMPKVLSDDRSE